MSGTTNGGARGWLAVALLLAAGGCGGGSDAEGEGEPCGPELAEVREVGADGSLELSSGESVRLLGVTLLPEEEGGTAPAAATLEFLACALTGHEVGLTYDGACTATDGALLAYVRRCDELVNLDLLRRGFAAYQPPADGSALRLAAELAAAAAEARDRKRGAWAD